MHALRVPGVWAGIGAFFLYVGIEVGAAQWAYSLLVEARGVSAAEGAATVSLFWVVFTGGRFLFGAIAGGRSVKQLLLMSLLFAVAGAAVFALGRGGYASAVGLALLGFGLAPVFPLLVAATPGRVCAANPIGALSWPSCADGSGRDLVRRRNESQPIGGGPEYIEAALR